MQKLLVVSVFLAALSVVDAVAVPLQSSVEAALEAHAAGEYPAAEIMLRNTLATEPENVTARVLMGRVLIAQGKLRESVDELEKSLALGGDQNLILTLLGRVYLQLLEPRKVLTSIVAPGNDPNTDAEIALIRAEAALQLGRLPEATENFIAAEKLLVNDPRPLVGEAQVALARGNATLAELKLAEALALDVRNVDALTLQGLMERDRGNLKAAAEAFDKAIESDPLSTKTLGARAALRLDGGDIVGAKSDVITLLATSPVDLEGIYLKSWIEISEGRFDEAREVFDTYAAELRDLDPAVVEKLPQLQLYFSIGHFFHAEYEQAIDGFKGYLARYPLHSGAQRFLAASYLSIGDWDKVIDVLNSRPGDPLPDDISVITVLAQAFRRKGNIRRAIQLYKHGLTIAPAYLPLEVELADCRFEAGDTIDAITALERIDAGAAVYDDARERLVKMYLAVGRYDDAIGTAKALVETNPASADYHNLLGVALMTSGRYDDANQEFRQANALAPVGGLAALNQARMQHRSGDIEGALAAYAELTQSHPALSRARLEYSRLLLEQREVELAREQLSHLLDENADDLEAQTAWLWVLLMRGETEALRQAIIVLEQSAPDNSQVQLALGRFYGAQGDTENSRLMLRRAAENAGFNTNQLYRIAIEQLTAARDADGALWSVTKALGSNKLHIGALGFRVFVLLALERPADAQEHLASMRDQYPERAETALAAGDLAHYERDLLGALKFYGKAHDSAPTRSSMMRLASTQVDVGDFNGALKTLRVWIITHPDDLDARHTLAEKFLQVGAFRKAQLVYEGILKRNETDPAALNNIAVASHRLGDPAARRYAERALAIYPENPGFLDTYGWILADTGDAERGLEILRDAYTRQSTNEEIRFHIALALLKLERRQAAVRELEAALGSGRNFASRDEAEILLAKIAAK